jgi:6,7-dimethyl-8-ribityllumazine synthase
MSDINVLIVESPYYEHIADGLAKGAISALEKAGASYDRVSVPGALEIPGAIALAENAALEGGKAYDGYVALGCVIRGETTHYEIVSGESARALMDLTVYDGVVIGNGVLTVENGDQAWARANPDDKDKGGGAAEAALAMINLRRKLAGDA